MDLNDRLSIRAEHYTSFLWNSAKDEGAEYRQTFKESCYRGTMVFGF